MCTLMSTRAASEAVSEAVESLACEFNPQVYKEHSTNSHEPRILAHKIVAYVNFSRCGPITTPYISAYLR